MKLKEYQKFLIILIVFLGAYFIPFDNIKVQKVIMEMFYMLSDYAHHHVLLCLVPAFFIAGEIAFFAEYDGYPQCFRN